MEVVIKTFPVMLMGAAATLQVTLISVAFGCIIGLIVGLARLSKTRLIKLAATAYVDFFRGTPLLVQIMIVYFALPLPQFFRDVQTFLMAQFLLPGFLDGFDVFMSGVVACSLNSGAYIAEIFRGGVQSIERGQVEAARSLGMTAGQSMRYVILPQAFKRVIPPLGNEFIAMLKDTSLLSVIGFAELTRRGQLIVGQTYVALPVWFTVALLYLAMTFTFSRLVDYTERRLKTGD